MNARQWIANMRRELFGDLAQPQQAQSGSRVSTGDPFYGGFDENAARNTLLLEKAHGELRSEYNRELLLSKALREERDKAVRNHGALSEQVVGHKRTIENLQGTIEVLRREVYAAKQHIERVRRGKAAHRKRLRKAAMARKQPSMREIVQTIRKAPTVLADKRPARRR